MSGRAQRLTTSILQHVAELPEGSMISAKELLHLGSRAAIDQSLSRLARRQTLLRAGRGKYVLSNLSRFGIRPPSVEAVLRCIEISSGETIAPDGIVAAIALGLTTQIPMRPLYITSGRSQQIKLGSQTVELRHVPAWQLEMVGRPAGEVIRALAWLGQGRAGSALQILRGRLPAPVLEEIASVIPRVPIWVAEQVSKLVADG